MRVTTLRLPAFDPLLLLCKLDASQRLPAYARVGRWNVIAWNPSATIASAKGSENDWKELQKAIDRRHRKSASVLPFSGGLIGYFSYDAGAALHGLPPHANDDMELPAFVFHEYGDAVLYDGKTVRVLGSRAFAEEVRATHERPMAPFAFPSLALSTDIRKSDYRKNFGRIREAILDGDIYQINYAHRFSGKGEGDRRFLFAALLHRHDAPRAAYFDAGDHALLSFSPEQFLSVGGRDVYTSPIKGTRPRGTTPPEDRRLREALLRSEKEKAELHMITDLLRNDLGKICSHGTVRVVRRRAVQSNPSVWHTYSVIGGRLDHGTSATDVFKAMLPGGSVTGCPKKRAMEYIGELEKRPRGPYTGSLALIDDTGRIESNILIRTLITQGSDVFLHAGGGIVADSIAKEEWDETLAKARPFLALSPPPFQHAPRHARYSVNGKVPMSDDPRLALLDPDNGGGFAAFETLRTYKRTIFAFDEHADRLRRSAALLGFRLPQDLATIGRWLRELHAQSGMFPARLKIVATPGDIILRCEHLIADIAAASGIGVAIVPLERDTPEAKSMPYASCIAAQQWSAILGCQEALLADTRGRIREAACSNLFWVERGILLTPGRDILHGITRQHVLRLAEDMKLDVRFATPAIGRLRQADEIFLTRTTVGIVPVIRIGKEAIGNGKPGRMTKRLMRRWEKEIGKIAG